MPPLSRQRFSASTKQGQTNRFVIYIVYHLTSSYRLAPKVEWDEDRGHLKLMDRMARRNQKSGHNCCRGYVTKEVGYPPANPRSGWLENKEVDVDTCTTQHNRRVQMSTSSSGVNIHLSITSSRCRSFYSLTAAAQPRHTGVLWFKCVLSNKLSRPRRLPT